MKCWNCDSEMVARVDDNNHPYGSCPKCGATNTELPKIDFSPLASQGFILRNSEGSILTHAQRPSKTVTRRASRARQGK